MTFPLFSAKREPCRACGYNQPRDNTEYDYITTHKMSLFTCVASYFGWWPGRFYWRLETQKWMGPNCVDSVVLSFIVILASWNLLIYPQHTQGKGSECILDRTQSITEYTHDSLWQPNLKGDFESHSDLNMQASGLWWNPWCLEET